MIANPCYNRTDLNACYPRNTEPNNEGFKIRYNSGKEGGINFIEAIKKLYGDITDTIKVDIVAHSMGYAYAQGIIEEIKRYPIIKLGRYYIIAPENAGSIVTKVEIKDFEEVMQFGTNENDTNIKLKKQDGVAPQTTVNGLDKEKHRHYYPKNDKKYPEGFVDSHRITNYGWIFDKNLIKKRE